MGVLDGLFRHRVIIATGKGGTGKTTVSATLALAAQRRGLRVAVVETHGASQIPPLFGLKPRGYTPQEVRPGIVHLTLTARDCVEDFVVKQVKYRFLYRAVFRNRVMGPFMDAVPGLPDLIQLGKIWDMVSEDSSDRTRGFDVIIVDAPSTGHGLTLLDSPRAMMEVTRTGPLHANAKRVHDLFSDPNRVALILVSLPDGLAVKETIQAWFSLGPFRKQIAFCVLNRLLAEPFDAMASWETYRECLRGISRPPITSFVDLTERWYRRCLAQTEARRVLSRNLSCPIIGLPLLHRPRLASNDLDDLAHALEEASLAREEGR